MTIPKWTEINQIEYLDQLLAYCVVVLDATNKDEDNLWWNNPAARANGKNSITWQVVKDDIGQRQFVWTAILDYWNPTPGLSKASLSQSILTITPHQKRDNQITIPSDGRGMRVPPIPPEIDTLERLLWWVVKSIEVCLLYAQHINYCNLSYWVPESLPIISFGINPYIIIPDDTIVPPAGLVGDSGSITVGEAFDNLNGGLNSDNSSEIPEWMSSALDSIGDVNNNANSEPPQQIDIGKPMSPSDPIYVDPNADVCKEVDPSLANYSKDGYQMLIEIIEDK